MAVKVSKTQELISRNGMGCRVRGLDDTRLEQTILRAMREELDLTVPKYIYEVYSSCLPGSTRAEYERIFGSKGLFDDLERMSKVGEDAKSVEEFLASVDVGLLVSYLVRIVRDSSFHAYNGELHCCWLSTYTACKLREPDVEPRCYYLPKRRAVVADKGTSGVLYVAADAIDRDRNLVKMPLAK